MGRRPHQPPRPLPAPFLGSQAVTAGLLTREQLRSKCWRLFRDVYVAAHRAPDHRTMIRGAGLLLPPGAAIGGRSAAHLYGATLAEASDPVEVSTPVPFGPVQGLRIRQRALCPGDVRTFAGIPVTTPLATAYELARSLPLEEAVVWVDALGHTRALRMPQVRALAAVREGEPGWRRAARALGLADPRAESPPESRVRLWLVLGGLPLPVPQYEVFDGGAFVARVDLAWPALKLAVEYDGHWHSDRGQLTRDRRRTRALAGLGWYVYPVTAADLRDPAGLVAGVRRVCDARGGALDRPA